MALITNNNNLTIQRNFLCRLVFGCIFFLLVYDFLSHASLQQLHSPALIFPYVDITYILFSLSKAESFVSESFFLSSCFSLFLFAFCIAAFIWPNKRISIALFFIFYFFYFLSYSNYGAHHIHSKIGILFIPIPFLFTGKNFLYAWEGLRYYALFVYADSFLWKLFRETWLDGKQGISIIKNNITPLLFSHPNYKLGGFYRYLFMHPAYADVLFKIGFVFEGLFMIGFFTKKYDKYLILLSMLLAFGFLLLADAFAFELLILDLTLIYNFRNKINTEKLK